MLPVIRKASPATRILVDSIDLHFLRSARGAFLAKTEGEAVRLLDQRFASEIMRELNVYAAADGVLTVSQKEADLLDDLLAGVSPAYPVHLAENLPRSPLPFEDRKGMLFIGNFRHAPNLDAVKYLCHEVLPLIDPAVLCSTRSSSSAMSSTKPCAVTAGAFLTSTWLAGCPRYYPI